MKDHKVSSPIVLKEVADDAHNYKALPSPTGAYPYRLDVTDIIAVDDDRHSEKITFHMLGDTGSLRYSEFQAVVADTLNEQSDRARFPEDAPAFLYHLGDIVYNHGEASAYPKQFLKPYERYGAPIFAIAGNHDGDINPESAVPYQSLEAFMDVFCDSERRAIGFGDGSKRESMVQPNVYWTMETPLFRIIGLYANVLKHGAIDDEQRAWFIEELRHAKLYADEQAILLCIHHAPYSADTNHGSSVKMIDFLEQAFEEADCRPDAVFSGHVHNYQRFSRHYPDGQVVPFIVAGAGGYVDLHSVATVNEPRVAPLAIPVGEVTLDNYCQDRYGFLKVGVERVAEELSVSIEYYVLPASIPTDGKSVIPSLFDKHTLALQRTLNSGS